jgi:hypothetical protein
VLKIHLGDEVTSYHQQYRHIEEDQKTTSGSNHEETQMELYRAYVDKCQLKHHETRTRIELKRTKGVEGPRGVLLERPGEKQRQFFKIEKDGKLRVAALCPQWEAVIEAVSQSLSSAFRCP